MRCKSYASHMRCKSYALYRECAGQVALKWEIKPDRRRIPDTTPWTKPVGPAYGDWFLTCVKFRRHGAHVGRRVEVRLSARREGIRLSVVRQ